MPESFALAVSRDGVSVTWTCRGESGAVSHSGAFPLAVVPPESESDASAESDATAESDASAESESVLHHEPDSD